MVSIGQVVRNARVFNLQNWRGTIMDDDSVQAVARLFAMLEQRRIKYVLVDGVALLQYVQGRNTEDIDLIMAVSSLKKIPEIQVMSTDIYFARGDFSGLQIDLLLTKNPLFARVQRDYTAVQSFQEQDITSATVDGLVLLKLYALPSLYRQGNFARVGLYENDLATLMYYHRPDINRLVDELTQYVTQNDLAAIRDIVVDLERRVARFQPTV